MFSSTSISLLAIFKVNLLKYAEAFSLEYVVHHHINLQTVMGCCQLPFLHQGPKPSYASMKTIVWLSLLHPDQYVCDNRFGCFYRDYFSATAKNTVLLQNVPGFGVKVRVFQSFLA